MKDNYTYLENARTNLEITKKILPSGDDELYVNWAAYHLQQAVEFAIKYEFEMNGIEYPKSHCIEKLIKLSNKENITLNIPDFIDEHAEMFSTWEEKTRYIKDYLVDRNKVVEAINYVEEYINNLEHIDFSLESSEEEQEISEKEIEKVSEEETEIVNNEDIDDIILSDDDDLGL